MTTNRRDQIIANMLANSIVTAPKPTPEIVTILDAMDDRRVRAERFAERFAERQGSHEPTSAYGGLYTLEEVDDSLVEPTKRSIEGGVAFVPVDQIAHKARCGLVRNDEALNVANPITNGLPTLKEKQDAEWARLQEVRARAHRDSSPSVFVRRRSD